MRKLIVAIGILWCMSQPAMAQPLESVPTPSTTINRTPPFKVGDTVEASGNWWGESKWYVSVILDMKDGQYRIHYGGGRYNTAWITEDKIRNEVREKAQQAQRDLQAAFWKDAAPYKDSVSEFVDFLMFPDRAVSGSLGNADRIRQALAGLTALDALCKAKYAALEDTETTWKDDYTRLPATWCKTAARRNEIATKYVTIAASQRVDENRKWLAKFPERYSVAEVHVAAGSWYAVLYPVGHEKVKGIYRSDELDDILDNGGAATMAKLQADIAPLFAAIGATEDAATLAFYDEARKNLADLKANVEANLPKSVFVAKGKDKAMQNAGKAGITGKILKSAVLSPKWVVTVDAYRHPENRVKIGSIVYQVGARCIYRSYVWKQWPRGRGWDAGNVTESTEFYQRCK